MRYRSGFTLVEATLVFASIALLLSVSAYLYGGMNKEKNASVAALEMVLTAKKISEYYSSRDNYAGLTENSAYESNLFAPSIRQVTSENYRYAGVSRAWRATEYLTTPGWRIRVTENISTSRPAGYNQEDGFQIALLGVPRPTECITVIKAIANEFDVLLLDDIVFKNIHTKMDLDGAVLKCQQSDAVIKIQGFKY